MPENPDPLTQLITALQILPNVGPKTAQRMAYALLEHKRPQAAHLAATLQLALEQVRHCQNCHTFCQDTLCAICANPQRDPQRLMIVHMPSDVYSMETSRCHDGHYFVLMGYINPLHNMDTNSLALELLIEHLNQHPQIKEIIIATAFTAEGDATAHVLYELLKTQPYRLSRLARGIPLGSELEYVDAGTLAQAVYERRLIKEHTPP